jgi:hypothetical protein
MEDFFKKQPIPGFIHSVRKTGLVHSWVTNHRWRGNHPSTRGLRLNLARVQREKVEFFLFQTLPYIILATYKKEKLWSNYGEF